MRKVFFWLHLAAGVVAGLVIFIMAVTGTLLMYEKQMTAWFDQRSLPAVGAGARLPVETLLDHASAGGAASHPLFLPYLFGERSPFEDRAVRGAFLGLDRGHGPGGLCRAVLEGIAFAIRHNLEAAGLPRQPLTVIGGGARSPLQQRFLAEVLNRPVIAPAASQEMPALGIYRMLAPRLGFEPVQQLTGSVTVEPHPSRAEAAERRYHSYRAASDFARELPRTMP